MYHFLLLEHYSLIGTTTDSDTVINMTHNSLSCIVLTVISLEWFNFTLEY